LQLSRLFAVKTSFVLMSRCFLESLLGDYFYLFFDFGNLIVSEKRSVLNGLVPFPC
jgi:hypothetical protein